MEYSIANALFISLPVGIAYFLFVNYARRRRARLTDRQNVQGPIINLDTNWQAVSIFLTVTILRVLAAIIVDNHWDNFRHAFKLPARSVDGLLLVGFAHVGMYALLLITLILLIEITDWLRAR